MSAGKADDDDPAAPRDRAQARIEDIAADAVDNHVGAALADRAHTCSRNESRRLNAGIDDVIGATRLRRRGFDGVLTAASTVAPSAFVTCTVASPTPLGSAGHEHHFPDFDPRALDEREMRGHVSQPHRRRLGITHRAGITWQLTALVTTCCAYAPHSTCTSTRSPGFHARYARADRLNDARAFLCRG
jgi:hypothetical protein